MPCAIVKMTSRTKTRLLCSLLATQLVRKRPDGKKRVTYNSKRALQSLKPAPCFSEGTMPLSALSVFYLKKKSLSP